MNIGIWGSYNHGNFGDDVMAIQFSKCVEELGHVPVIYRLYDSSALNLNVRTESSLEVFVRESDKLIIGGGGMMTGTQLKRAAVRPMSLLAELDYLKLRKCLLSNRREILPLSIGSDGARSASSVPYFRRRLLAPPLCRYATVRLKSDVGLMAAMGVRALYAPDIVYSLPEVFPLKRQPRADGLFNVGINLSARRCGYAIRKIEEWAKQRNRVRLTYLRTHRNSAKYTYEYVPRKIDEKQNRMALYSNPQQFINELCSLDLTVSSKLHVGLIGQVYGTPFISYLGSGKARLELGQRGLSDRVFVKGDEPKLIACLDRFLSLSESLRRPDGVGELAVEAALHSEALKHFIAGTMEAVC